MSVSQHISQALIVGHDQTFYQNAHTQVMQRSARVPLFQETFIGM
jgi:hypothetical protein